MKYQQQYFTMRKLKSKHELHVKKIQDKCQNITLAKFGAEYDAISETYNVTVIVSTYFDSNQQVVDFPLTKQDKYTMMRGIVNMVKAVHLNSVAGTCIGDLCWENVRVKLNTWSTVGAACIGDFVDKRYKNRCMAPVCSTLLCSFHRSISSMARHL